VEKWREIESGKLSRRKPSRKQQQQWMQRTNTRKGTSLQFNTQINTHKESIQVGEWKTHREKRKHSDEWKMAKEHFTICLSSRN